MIDRNLRVKELGGLIARARGRLKGGRSKDPDELGRQIEQLERERQELR